MRCRGGEHTGYRRAHGVEWACRVEEGERTGRGEGAHRVEERECVGVDTSVGG